MTFFVEQRHEMLRTKRTVPLMSYYHSLRSAIFLTILGTVVKTKALPAKYL